MRLKLLAMEMKATAEEHVIKTRSFKTPKCCARRMMVDQHNLQFVLTLHEKRHLSLRLKEWQLTVVEEDEKEIPPKVMSHVLHSFFGHSDFAHEPPQEMYADEAQYEHARTFFAPCH